MTLAANQVAFYGAEQSDYINAVAAAEANLVPMANVTGDFNTAATWVENGTYMVIAVGHDANMALYWNPCGWSTSAYSSASYPACSTPFAYYSYPYDGSIIAGLFESADGETSLDTLQIATMLGYYAIHGTYPSTMNTLPTVRELSGQTCSTSDCAGSASNTCPSSVTTTTCTVPTTTPAEGDYPVCTFVSNYEDWAKFAACKMGSNPIPTSLILAQWGNESGWGGGDISVCYNPGNQGATCGVGSECYPSGYTELCFCSLEEGVASYANLMSKGYPFVAATYHYYAKSGNYAEGVKQAGITLGQGYSPIASLNTYIDYCGWSGTPSASTPRLWAKSEYNDGNGPGSALYDTIQANSWLYNLDSTT